MGFASLAACLSDQIQCAEPAAATMPIVMSAQCVDFFFTGLGAEPLIETACLFGGGAVIGVIVRSPADSYRQAASPPAAWH
jgi:hypothetical protein